MTNRCEHFVLGASRPVEKQEVSPPAPQLMQSTVDIKVECRHAVEAPVGYLVAEALREFMVDRPSAPAGTFESRGGLDVTWRTSSILVDADGRPLETAIPAATAATSRSA